MEAAAMTTAPTVVEEARRRRRRQRTQREGAMTVPASLQTKPPVQMPMTTTRQHRRHTVLRH
jgi:hypothetical protein